MTSISFIYSLNILLAHDTAKLGDFGFALDMPAKHAEDHTTATLVTAPMLAQTNGYSPPEIQSGKISPKSDVYSYGIVSSCKCMNELCNYVLMHAGITRGVQLPEGMVGEKRGLCFGLLYV